MRRCPAGDFSPFGESQHRICLDVGHSRRPAKRPVCGQKPAPTLETEERMKDTTFSIRIASDDLDIIKRKAKQARLSQSDYVTRCCLGRQVVVVEDLKEVLKQQRAIGNNLNQLTVLANMGRVSVANLDGAAQELKTISETLREIAERGRWTK
jgi:hypothetical protein